MQGIGKALGQSLDQAINDSVRQKGAGGIVDQKNVCITSGCNPGGHRVLPLSSTRYDAVNGNFAKSLTSKISLPFANDNDDLVNGLMRGKCRHSMRQKRFAANHRILLWHRPACAFPFASGDNDRGDRHGAA
jgi:hypothetical protein